MDLQTRIVSIKDYFRGLDMKGGLYIVKVEFPQQWGVFQNDDSTIKVTRSETSATEFYYYGKITDTTIDSIFDIIESTISMNRSAEAKVELMKEKVEELKELFGTHSLEELKNLKFVMEEKKKRTYTKKKVKVEKAVKPKRKYTRKVKEASKESVEQEVVNEENVVKEEVVNA